ncbi:acyltransferase [Leptospira sp. 96542]|nr:acyltransferase [Leptospira sp. 96542]
MYKYFIDQFQSSNRDDNQLYGIRAISCFLVILIHTFHFAQNHVIGIHPFVMNYVQNFEFIMDIFFLMSAYLVSASFLKDYSKNGLSASWKNFALKRSFRIFPLFLFVLFLYIVSWRFSLEIASKAGTLTSEQIEYGNSMAWYSDLFYISNYFENRLMSHGWSLSLEEQFYLILPILLFVLSKTKKFHHRIPTLVLLFLILGIVIRGIIFSTENIFDFASYKKQIFEPTHSRFEPFILGTFLAIARLNKIQLFINRIPQIKIGLIITALILLAFNSFSIEEIPLLFYAIRITVFSLFSYFLIYFTLENQNNNLFKTILSNKFFVPIGKLSYGIYLLHFPIVVLIMNKFRAKANITEFGYLDLILCSVLSFAVTFLLANVTYILIEKPFIRIREWTQLRFDISKNVFYTTNINKAELTIVIFLLNILFFLPFLCSLALLKVNFFFGSAGKLISYSLLVAPIVAQIYHLIRYKKSYFRYIILKYQTEKT